jgi:hypothetical protein
MVKTLGKNPRSILKEEGATATLETVITVVASDNYIGIGDYLKC